LGFFLMVLQPERYDADIVLLLVHTKRERATAQRFLDWFRSKGGRATKGEVSKFANQLATGELGIKYGRTTFYNYILKQFINHGLIGLDNEFDHESRKVIKVYKRIIQPKQVRRPSGPSLLYNAHHYAEVWNEIFSE